MPWESFFKIKKNPSPKPSKEEERVIAKKAIHFPYDFDRWYPRLKDFSFNSKIISISPLIAKAMVHFYQQKYLHKNTLTLIDIKILKKFEKSIQRYLNNKKMRDGVFVRMSNRSPKDGMPLLSNGETMLSTYEFILKNGPDKTLNDKMLEITDRQMKWLRCTSAQQVMSLLLSSERVYADLNLALDCAHNNRDKWSTSVILRDWQHALKQDMEFRVFVSNNKITAISQYNHYCKYPSLTGENASLDTIYQKLMAFTKSVHPAVKVENYVLDLAIINERVYIIELNPLDETTGACLFSWKEDRDLLTGKLDTPATFRVRQEPLENLDVIIDTIVSEQASVGEHDQEPYFNLYEESYCPTIRPKGF